MKKVSNSEEKEIAVIEKKIAPVVQEAKALKIKSDADMVAATEMLSKINQLSDKMTEEKERVTKPLNEALKAERSRWKPRELVLDEARDDIRGKMSAYQTEQVRAQREEEAKIAARIGEGRGKLKIETAVKKFDEMEKAPEQVSSAAGLVKFREDKVLKIVDESKIPRDYLLVDEKKVLAALKAGVVVPGAEIELKQIPVNFR